MVYSCPLSGCVRQFPSRSKLEHHIDTSTDHEKCEHCDFLTRGWEDLVKHKSGQASAEITAQMQWGRREKIREFRESNLAVNLDDERARDPKPELKHLCCKFCGESFNSIAGRDRHVKLRHPPRQNVKCAGCKKDFPSAAGMVFHIENGLCPVIPRNVFLACITYKNLIKELLLGPDCGVELQGERFRQAATDKDVGGGVLLDGHELEQPWVLEPESFNEDPFPPLHTQNIPATKDRQAELASRMVRLSVAPHHQRPGEARKLEVQPVGQPIPTAHGINNTSMSKRLFPGAKATPANPVNTSMEPDDGAQHGFQILNPIHHSFNPQRFYNPILEHYVCPFPRCTAEMLDPSTLKAHLSTGHIPDKIRCPCCCKLFKSYTSLVSHCETATVSGKCFIADARDFETVFDQLTGGLVVARKLRREDFERGIDGSLISYVKYEAAGPGFN